MARKWHGNLICLMFVVCILVTILASCGGEPQADWELVEFTQEKYILPDGTTEWADEVAVTFKVTNTGDVEIEEFRMFIVVSACHPHLPYEEDFSKEISGGPIKRGRHVMQTFVVHIDSAHTTPLQVYDVGVWWFWFDGEEIWYG